MDFITLVICVLVFLEIKKNKGNRHGGVIIKEFTNTPRPKIGPAPQSKIRKNKKKIVVKSRYFNF